jgi:hypothetical protein
MRTYGLDDVRKILDVQKAMYRMNMLTFTQGDEALDLLDRMKQYPEVWPEDAVSRAYQLTEQINRLTTEMAGIHVPGPPDFHHSTASEITDYEKERDDASRQRDELRRQCDGFKSERKQVLSELGF